MRRLLWVATATGSFLCEAGSVKTAYSSCLQVDFDEYQFETRRADAKRNLKPNAIPTIFPYCEVRRARITTFLHLDHSYCCLMDATQLPSNERNYGVLTR